MLSDTSAASISYRVAVGPQQGRKAFMIRTIRPLDRPDSGLERVAKANGFSLHAGVSCEGHQRGKRERLCRYIARPAVATPRLSLSSTGKVVYTLKAPYSDGTTQVVFDRGGHPPVDFMPDWQPSPERGPAKTQGQSDPLPWRIGPARPDPITDCVGWSLQPGVVEASSLSPMRKSAHLLSTTPQEPAPLYRV